MLQKCCIGKQYTFVQNSKYMGATVIELCFFNQIKKKKKEKNMNDN